jgi:hypothetical protein
MPFNDSSERVLAFQSQTLRLSFRACREISYCFRVPFLFSMRDISTSSKPLFEMANTK